MFAAIEVAAVAEIVVAPYIHRDTHTWDIGAQVQLGVETLISDTCLQLSTDLPEQLKIRKMPIAFA